MKAQDHNTQSQPISLEIAHRYLTSDNTLESNIQLEHSIRAYFSNWFNDPAQPTITLFS